MAEKYESSRRIELNPLDTFSVFEHFVFFYINYKVNFERVLKIEHPVKQKFQLTYLREMADRVTVDHGFAQFYTAVLEEKNGNYEEAQNRIALTEKALAESAYWRDKFAAFDVYSQLEDLKSKLNRKSAWGRPRGYLG